MRERIDHLENLVKKLITERTQVPSPPENALYTPEGSNPESGPALSAASFKAPSTAGLENTVMDGVHSIYVGGDDWHIVLQQVNSCIFGYPLIYILGLIKSSPAFL